MIIQHYLDLATVIRDQVPAILWRDIDKGQLDQQEEGYTESTVPVVPCVLIKFSEIQWNQLGRGQQQGDGTVTLKLALYLTDTHDTSPLMATNLDNLLLATHLHEAVDKVSWMKGRVGSNDYHQGNLWIVEQTYQVILTPDPPNYRTVTVPVKLDLQLTTNPKQP